MAQYTQLFPKFIHATGRRSTIRTTRHFLPKLLYALSNEFALVDIAAVDRLASRGRFAVKYCLLSHRYNVRLTVMVCANETLTLPSVKAIFPSAGWLEREVWDLFGLYFHDNGDLRRILTDYGFTGHPLRKDFPLSGFHEVVYNDAEGRVTTEPVELAQELRVFAFGEVA